MFRFFQNSLPLLLWGLANGLLMLGLPAPWGELATVILLLWLPGWVWLPRFLNPHGPPLPFLARALLAVGLSLSLIVFGMLFLVYLPLPLTPTGWWYSVNIIILIGYGLNVRRMQAPPTTTLPRRLRLILLSLIMIGLLLRLPQLGYAEFHEDEAEALMLGVRLLQGEDYALFLHRKGPAQMLLPLSFWLLHDTLNEELARLPFALSSLCSILTLFFLGRHWFDTRVGLMAALLWAINGYAIAFGRMVQYQALIFFLGPLALYALSLARRGPHPRLGGLAALYLATCLLAHFDALLLLPAAVYLSWQLWQRGLRHTVLWSGLLFGMLLMAFYVPYLLDPEFQNTATYLTESRVKPGLLYNNLPLLHELDTTYSSRFYLPPILLGIVLLVWRLGGWGGGLLLALALSTAWEGDWWRTNGVNGAIGPWLLLGGWLFWQLSRGRAALLLLGGPFIGYGFLVDDPRTHLYILYPGLLLLASVGYSALIDRFPASRYRVALACLLLPLLSLSALYQSLIFLTPEAPLNRLQQREATSTMGQLFAELPAPRHYFGYPKREGWKAIGVLRAWGHFPGDFRSVNEDFIVPIWYNFAQARSCYETPAQFFVRPAEEPLAIPAGYTQTAVIQREGESRLHVLSAQAHRQAVWPVELTTYAPLFDALATVRQFQRQTEPSITVGTQFGEAIWFSGYDLPQTQFTAGETLRLTLYWRAVDVPSTRYRVFVHLTDGSTLWAQQDDDPACRLPTSIWRAGQQGVGQFRLPLNPETPPGRYPLIIGLYDAETLVRLPISKGTGQPGDDFLWLGDIEVFEP